MKKVFAFSVWIASSFLLPTSGCDNSPYCPEGTSWCWAKCVNLSKANDNCGECTCVAGYTDCSGQCVNLAFDAENCGSCGNTCREGEHCQNGACSIEHCSTDFGLTNCGTACVDTTVDRNHCGACFNACGDNQECIDSQCVDVCVCHEDADCMPGYCCMSCMCFPKGCEGKCCGDDGCGGTCPDECDALGMTCIPSTCSCSEPGQLGDPCPYENAHLDMPECNVAEEAFCVGFKNEEDFTCPNGTDEECDGYLAEWYNLVCVDGYCKGSICTRECKRLCDCPHGFRPIEYRDDQYVCIPGIIEPSGYVCAFGDVNDCYGDCGVGYTCLGSYPSAFIGLCPSGYFTECRKYVPPRFDPDCIDGLCGLSFCAFDCVNDGCDTGYEPTDLSGNCKCFPIPDPSSEGMPCELGDVNALWGICEPGLTCVGLPADGSNGDCPNGIPDCSSIPSSWNPFCSYETNHCGASFCTQECSAGACEAGFVPFDYGGTCYCAPEG
jgi:hypothetical protein